MLLSFTGAIMNLDNFTEKEQENVLLNMIFRYDDRLKDFLPPSGHYDKKQEGIINNNTGILKEIGTWPSDR